jgi:D-psicose/D-tagatose/L-ribulose 3-epimerase
LLALPPWPRSYETNLLNTTQQGMELLADINHAAVKLHIDTYHMNIEENSMAQVWKAGCCRPCTGV